MLVYHPTSKVFPRFQHTPNWWCPERNGSLRNIFAALDDDRNRRFNAPNADRGQLVNWQTRAKWMHGRPYGEVHGRVGSSPTLVIFGGKSLKDPKDKIRGALRRILMAAELLGWSVVTGGGFGGMGMGAETGIQCLEMLERGRREPFIQHFIPKVVSVPIDISLEPANPHYTHLTEPISDLMIRTSALMHMGVPLIFIVLPGGDSTLLELWSVIATRKGTLRREIDTPFKHHSPLIAMLDYEGGTFYDGSIEQFKAMIECAESPQRRERKLAEMQQLLDLYLRFEDPCIAKKIIVAADRKFAEIYGASALAMFNRENRSRLKGRPFFTATDHFAQELADAKLISHTGEPPAV